MNPRQPCWEEHAGVVRGKAKAIKGIYRPIINILDIKRLSSADIDKQSNKPILDLKAYLSPLQVR